MQKPAKPLKRKRKEEKPHVGRAEKKARHAEKMAALEGKKEKKAAAEAEEKILIVDRLNTKEPV